MDGYPASAYVAGASIVITTARRTTAAARYATGFHRRDGRRPSGKSSGSNDARTAPAHASERAGEPEVRVPTIAPDATVIRRAYACPTRAGRSEGRSR